MAREFEEAYVKYLEWNRENNGRLYYVLWILFMGGFVYTFKLRPVTGCPQYLGVALFRLLAIAGTVLNFRYQENAIDSLGKLREQLFEDDSHNQHCAAPPNSDGRKTPCNTNPECLSETHYAKARIREIEVNRLERIGNNLQIALRAVTYAFLVFALGLSFLLFPL